MPKYIVSLLQKTSNDTFMTDKKPELSAAMKSKLEPKKFTKNPILGTKFTIAISSAKGGVGKSTFATNLALALKKVGCKVGLLDADIYGPSIPKMFDINEKPKSDGQKLDPITKYDIQCMSIGFLADQQTPMIWRGPMVTSAIKTFTQKVNWKDLDFIIVDMPPGTGDTQLTFSQEIKMDGAIIVSTPQEVALLDVKRGIKMFDKLGVKILGLVDNMSFFIGDDGKKYKIFGEGGVEKMAKEFNKKVLGNNFNISDVVIHKVFGEGVILNISKDKVDNFLIESVDGENFNRFIVIKDSKNGPELTWVKIGASDLSHVEIVSGLEIKDTVFILPSKSLFDYQKRFKERVQASFSFG